MADPVRLTTAPNSPLAEMLCERLRANGIKAFYRATSPWGGGVTSSIDPAFPAEVYVQEQDLESARGFLPK
jgi:hypothetical protein